MELSLNSAELNSLFPFHFALNRQLEIISIGSSLQKVLPSVLINKLFESGFKFKRPALSISYSYKSISEHLNHLFILDVLNSNTNLSLRGQFALIEKGEILLFVGSPWLTDVDDLETLNLKINDFAISDNITDLLHVIKSEKLAMQDVKSLAGDLKRERDILTDRNRLIEDLAKFPEENPNLVMRYDVEGKILFSNKKSKNFLDLLETKIFNDKKKLFLKKIIEVSGNGTIQEIEISFDSNYYQVLFVPINSVFNYVNVYAVDVTQRKLAEINLADSEKRLSILYEVTKLFSNNESVESNFIEILHILCDTYNWVGAGFWKVNLNEELENVSYYCLDNYSLNEYYTKNTKNKFKKGEGFVGQAFLNKSTIYANSGSRLLIDSSVKDKFSAFAFPIVIKGKVIAVLDFIYDKAIESESNVLNLLQALGLKIARYLEKVKADNDLKFSEEKYRLIVENATDIIYRINETGKFTFVNPVTCRITGFSEDELLNTNFLSLVRKDFREKTLNFYKKQVDERIKSTYFEFPILTKSGEERWIGQSVQMSEFLEKNNDIISLASDITERKNTQMELSLALSRLTSLISNLNTGVLLENSKREIVLVNNVFCKIFQIPGLPEQLLGVDCSNAAQQSKALFEDEEGFVNKIALILQKKEKVIGEHLKMKDGRVFERDYIPVFSDEKYLGHLWQYKDITDSINYDKRIKEQKAFYETILNSIPADLVVFDKDHRYLFVNPNSVKDPKMREWLVGKTDLEYCLYTNKDISIAKKREEFFNESVRSGKSIELNEEMVNKEGKIEHHLRIMNPIYNGNNELIFVIGYGVNVTTIKEAERQLKRSKEIAENSSRTKEQFLANMSHEVRTPMNAIIGITGLLKDTNLDSIQKGYLNSIDRSSKHLLVIINDILDLSKIESGKLTVEKIGFRFANFIENIINDFLSDVKERDLTISYSIDKNIDDILIGDPYRLSQVLLNLLNNAVKFTYKGSVTLTCKLISKTLSHNEIMFSVVDTGVGIDKEKLDSIFDSFTQEDDSTSRKFGGTGLGLTISKQIVKIFNSDIKVESVKGKGSKFFFTINLSVGNVNDIPVENTIIVNKEALAGINILLAEDNEVNQFLVMKILESWNVNVTIANNGLEAVNLLKLNQYDLVLMDIQMPILNGYETTKVIRNELFSKVPIIALTANAIQGDNEKCLEVGMNDYLSKPFSNTDLFNKIYNIVIYPLRNWKSLLISPVEFPSDENKTLFDLSKLNKAVDGNTDFALKLITLFIQTAPNLITELQSAAEAHDISKVKELLHKLKPSLELIGVEEFKRKILVIEKSDSINLNFDTFRISIMELISDLKILISQLRNY